MSDKTLVERLRDMADESDKSAVNPSTEFVYPVKTKAAEAILGRPCVGRQGECELFMAIADAIEREYLPRPRFEDGEPVQFGDEYKTEFGETGKVNFFCFADGGGYRFRGGEHWNSATSVLKRQKPEVLDADGVPIKVGDVVYDKNAVAFRVDDLNGIGITIKLTCIVSGVSFSLDPATLTHEEPDSITRIVADALKRPCDYFESRFGQCEDCRAYDRLNKGGCSAYQALDLLRRQREVMERDHER